MRLYLKGALCHERVKRASDKGRRLRDRVGWVVVGVGACATQAQGLFFSAAKLHWGPIVDDPGFARPARTKVGGCLLWN